MTTFTPNEYILGIAIRIDPIHQPLPPVDGIETYQHRSIIGVHPFQGCLGCGPEKIIPHPHRPDRTLTIGGQSPISGDGYTMSAIYCEGCGLMVGTVFFLEE